MLQHSPVGLPSKYHDTLIIITILLISMLSSASSPVHADSAQYIMISYSWIYDENELTYAENLAYWIAFAAYYGYRHVDHVYMYLDNLDYTYILYFVAPAHNMYYPAHVFYYGWGYYIEEDDYTMYGIWDSEGNPVFDYEIYEKTTEQRVRLVFMQACYLGREISGGDSYVCTWPQGCELRHHGMPRAWLHTTLLSQDGYLNPDYSELVFIGWYGPAPALQYDLQDPWPRHGNENFTDFAYKFVGAFFSKIYGYYTDPGNVIRALDYAVAHATEGSYISFDDSPFHDGFTIYNEYMDRLETTKIVVYGDGTYEAPEG